MQSDIHRGRLKAAAFAGMFLFGVVMALLGAVLPLLAGRLAFDLAGAGNLFLGMNFAMLASMMGLGPLMDRLGIKPALSLGAALMAAALVRIASADTYGAVMAGGVLLGLGGGALNGGANTLVADLHQHPREKSSALNILGIFFGIGALFLPFAIGSLIELLGWAPILYFTAALGALLALASLAMAFPPPKAAGGLRPAELGRVVRDPLVLLLGFLLFFQSGNEFIVGGYLSSFVSRELGAPITTASYCLAAYWGSILAGRLAASRLVLRLEGRIIVLGSAAVTAAGVLVLVGSPGYWQAAVGTVLTGLGFAGIYPAVLAFAGSRYQERSGTVFGILFSIALVGGMALPWLVGRIGAAAGLRAGLLVAAANAAAVFALQLAAARR
jgi:fucose permease